MSAASLKAVHSWLLVLLLGTTLGAGLASSGPTRPEAGGIALAAPSQPAAPGRPARFAEPSDEHAALISLFARRYRIAKQLSGQIYEAARAERVSPALAFGLVRVESGFDPAAVGPGGTIGLTQIRHATARSLAPQISAQDLYVPRLNLRLGFRYLHDLLELFDHDMTLALAAYNRGPTHVQGQLERGLTPTSSYARKVLRDVDRGRGATL